MLLNFCREYGVVTTVLFFCIVSLVLLQMHCLNTLIQQPYILHHFSTVVYRQSFHSLFQWTERVDKFSILSTAILLCDVYVLPITLHKCYVCTYSTKLRDLPWDQLRILLHPPAGQSDWTIGCSVDSTYTCASTDLHYILQRPEVLQPL